MDWLLHSLIHPGLIWFLPLAVIPIILHLLTLFRLKTVELSTFRFLFDSYVQQRRRTQFLEALLAMLRTLFLLFLVLVLCRPIVKKHWTGMFQSGSGRDVVMLIDCSASMKAQTAGMSAFDRAKIAAQSVIDRLGGEDRLTLVRVAAQPEEMFSQFVADVESIRKKVEGLKTTAGRANMFAALVQVFNQETQRRGKPLVYVITDCQAQGWKEVGTVKHGLERLIPAGTEMVVVNVGSNEQVPNLAVTGQAPAARRTILGHPVYLEPRVTNFSKGVPGAVAAEVSVAVFIDDKEVARTPLSVPPGETVAPPRKVIYFPSAPGIHNCRFEVSTKAPDRFQEDNDFLFTLTVVPRVRVVLVNGNPAIDPLENECLHLRTALASTRAAGTKDGKPAVKEGLSSMDMDIQEMAEPALNPEVLRDASVVILANCGLLNEVHFNWLREFVAGGGGLIILPGDRVNPDHYNSKLLTISGTTQEPLTAVRLGPPQGDPEKAEAFAPLSVDYGHPIFRVFDDSKSRYFATTYVKRHFPLVYTDDQRDNTTTLAELGKDAPAVVESRFGDGRVILAGFPANPKWTNLPLKVGEFVPLIKRLVAYVQHRPDVELLGPTVVAPDSMAEIAVAGSWAPVTGQVTDQAHGVTPVTFERAGSRFHGAFEGTGNKGFYTVEVKSNRPELAKSGQVCFAVNLAPEESDFRLIDEAQLRELLPTAKVTLVDASAEAQQDFGAIGNEREIWDKLIWLVFIIIIVEFLLATLGGQKKALEEQPTVAERVRGFTPGSWIGRMTGAGRKEAAT